MILRGSNNCLVGSFPPKLAMLYLAKPKLIRSSGQENGKRSSLYLDTSGFDNLHRGSRIITRADPVVIVRTKAPCRAIGL